MTRMDDAILPVLVLLLALTVASGAGAQNADIVAGDETPRDGAIVRLASPRDDEERVRSLRLERGKSVFLRTAFTVKRVSVGDPEVVDVAVLSPREVQLVPSRIGNTNLVLWESGGEPTMVLDVQVGTSYTHIERQLRSTLHSPDIRVDNAGEGIVLYGTVASPVQVERALAIAKAYFPEDADQRVVNALEVGGNQQVMIEVIIAEMERSLGRRLSVNWDSIIRTGSRTISVGSLLGDLVSIDERTTSLDGTVSTVFDFTDRIDVFGSFVNDDDFLLSYFIEAATENGLAKVLAKPTLLARSGQTASFLAGGEVPIPIAQGGAFGSITIEFKPFGVGILFAPTVLGPDRIHLEVSPEVSEPDFTLGLTASGFTTPGFITRRASTSVELADGQSFAIAGLLQDNVRETVEKFPLLGDLPILGALFRSARFQRDETELVLIVTPRLVEPLTADLPLPTDAYVAPSDFEFYLLGALESQWNGSASGADTALLGPSGHRVPVAMED